MTAGTGCRNLSFQPQSQLSGHVIPKRSPQTAVSMRGSSQAERMLPKDAFCRCHHLGSVETEREELAKHFAALPKVASFTSGGVGGFFSLILHTEVFILQPAINFSAISSAVQIFIRIIKDYDAVKKTKRALMGIEQMKYSPLLKAMLWP